MPWPRQPHLLPQTRPCRSDNYSCTSCGLSLNWRLLMECQFPRAATLDINAACERRMLSLVVFPSRGGSISQQNHVGGELQASELIELNLGPSSTLCVFGQYRI